MDMIYALYKDMKILWFERFVCILHQALRPVGNSSLLNVWFHCLLQMLLMKTQMSDGIYCYDTIKCATNGNSSISIGTANASYNNL